MLEGRRLRRMHVISYLKVHERNTDDSIGRLVDITTEGVGLYSEEPIDINRIYQFRMTLPTALKKKKEITFDARVVWCHQAVHPGFYDSGIQLLDVPPKDIEVIEQFIEEATLEDRWLSVD